MATRISLGPGISTSGLFDPEVEFDNSNAMLDAAVYHGPEGLREYLSLLREM